MATNPTAPASNAASCVVASRSDDVSRTRGRHGSADQPPGERHTVAVGEPDVDERGIRAQRTRPSSSASLHRGGLARDDHARDRGGSGREAAEAGVVVDQENREAHAVDALTRNAAAR